MELENSSGNESQGTAQKSKLSLGAGEELAQMQCSSEYGLAETSWNAWGSNYHSINVRPQV